jgi:type IV pilus assembly protein PilM
MGTNRKPGPRLACEITPERIIAARSTQDGNGLDAYTARSISGGTVLPRLTEENIANADLLKQAITDALNTVGATSRDLVAVLPDASVRIALLEFDSLPDKKVEADGVVRFRLKKVLPFDVERASVSYDVHRVNGKIHVVTAVVLSSVLAEYENLFRDLGYAPGVVVPSAIASLGNVTTEEPVLVIKADATTTSLAIISNHQLMLFRTLENQGGTAPMPDQLAHDVYASLIFFQDTYNTRVNRILVGGLIDAQSVASVLESQAEVQVEDLLESSRLGLARPNFPPSVLAGVVGALLG